VAPLSEHIFAQFYEETRKSLWSYVYRVTGHATDADDIVQDAFCRLLRADVGALSATDLRRYLFGTASNLVTDRWRRAEREHWWRRRAEPATQVEPAALHDDVTRTFAELKPQERALLWLAHVEEEPHEQIAEALGLRRGSVKVLLSRARAHLRERLNALNAREGT
jgi:RNA polymerase sigma-70 factor (ECF subfamily)